MLVQFDQEMSATAAGGPSSAQFDITVVGVPRTPTVVQLVNDSPPADAVLAITFDGAPLTAGQTVEVTRLRPRPQPAFPRQR
ncbi:MAG TPA: hypothetical protein VFW65_00085 [Pseudonocardiaceae bacterium]|nr:hypothetical protein [Pseudonocardiaceae bacterium]